MALAFITACASDQASRYYGNTRYPPTPVESVAILNAPPSRPYEVLADFQSRGESPQDMQQKAAKIGAHAVIVAMVGGYRSSSDEWAGEDSMRNTYTRIVATAIRYKESTE